MSIEKTDFYQSLQIQQRNADQAKKSNEMGKQEFMRLLVTQLENQDPLNPQDNTEFIAQLAQFSSLEGITNLNTTVGQFATSLQSTQALQASTLVGRQVQVLTNWSELEPGKSIKGTIDLPKSAGDVFVAVYAPNGEYLGDISLGSRGAGEISFEWDGLDTDGESFPAGAYQFRAYATHNGEHEAVDMYLSRNVTSVALNAGARGEIMLNLSGSDTPVPLREVKVIN
ncbi:flagellar hook assembly protein FlgD [Marinospirillum alkaliphilum]|uniref:Basal-body rod modification protein FlgD n=1 Tax=Marinospirillum alkaliphilum DSM 21637 TaxID=1122209 RepID=A0A1K1UZJ2_9GAMM|nr:flagellar hook assembly protein FlgD [Marinospirillum alkaliphilum]SFX18224.1 flagellar basal-body rod modification protein FlgD [Marinospirillum alkaliphilum DSM 21637]